MNTNLEERLAAGMRDRVDGLALTRDVLAEATRRHRRRTALVRTTYAAGVVGVVGALAAVATIGAPVRTADSPPVAGRPPAASAESPQMRLAAAAAASENISYRVKVTTTSKDKAPPKGELPEPVSRSWVTTGAFDPTTATGYLDSPYTGLRPVVAAGFEHERLIGGVRYIGAPNGSVGSNGEIVWSREPGTHDNLNFDLALDGGLGASADPQDLFRALRQAGAKVTETAGGYHFEVTVEDRRSHIVADSFVGDVTLGADNRIATVTYDRTARSSIRGENFTYHLHVAIELSDYGMPVKVEKPAGALARSK
ncbi:hypothetical protein NCC78_21100 [Micromonospora phytophila]|uniref:hypothetical protein n=1 Tax=Micromonospora phytophila TaxID=709888 RepID=UPI00202FF264|nr:hypothetical protein [Micromonospora phytophila]MCM0677167.1 hypothetical protein [Micromonospora phytophila]